MTSEDMRLQVFRDITERGMILYSMGGVSSVICPHCSYQAQVDWTDEMFGRLHSCERTEKLLAALGKGAGSD